MLLRERLQEYTKEQLMAEAKSFELKKYSGLRKAELVERLVESFCTKEMLRKRLVCLTKEEMDLFRKSCVEPQKISRNDVIHSMQMYRYWLGAFDRVTDQFCVFEEVRDIFQKMDDEGFRKEQRKKGWLMKCIRFFIEYYGLAPLEVIHELYHLKRKDSIEEMISMLWGMPMDIVESCIFPMEGLVQEEVVEHPMYSMRGILIHIPVLENQGLRSLLEEQADKKFYIPSAQQIEEICRMGYEENSLAYKKLKEFFIKKSGKSKQEAETMCLLTWAGNYKEECLEKIMEGFNEMGFVLEKEEQLNELIELLVAASNHTRRKENRGHNPNELVKKESIGKMTTIMPESTKAASLLEEVAPGLKEMGVTVDMNGNAQTIPISIYPGGLNGPAVTGEKKIYPNDPCPCGSGKKYKKCCGKSK